MTTWYHWFSTTAKLGAMLYCVPVLSQYVTVHARLVPDHPNRMSSLHTPATCWLPKSNSFAHVACAVGLNVTSNDHPDVPVAKLPLPAPPIGPGSGDPTLLADPVGDDRLR